MIEARLRRACCPLFQTRQPGQSVCRPSFLRAPSSSWLHLDPVISLRATQLNVSRPTPARFFSEAIIQHQQRRIIKRRYGHTSYPRGGAFHSISVVVLVRRIFHHSLQRIQTVLFCFVLQRKKLVLSYCWNRIQ